MLAATKVQMSWQQKELGSFWKIQVVVVQNNGKEMYKKSVLHVQSFIC